MSMSRVLRKIISRVLIGVLLFAQFAVASYACPGLNGRQVAAGDTAAAMTVVVAGDDTAAAQPAGMPPGCDQMDPDAVNLCDEHCRFGQQSADTASVPAVQVAIPTFLYSLPVEPQHSLGSDRSLPAVDAGLAAAPEPPHAILHCVYRI